MTDALFVLEGDRFVPTRLAGSPWGEGLVHGGPPAGLLARAIERHAGAPDMHVARLTVDLFRPVPMQPLAVRTRTLRAGTRIHVAEASLWADDVEVCRATGLLLRTSPVDVPRNEEAFAVPDGPDGLATSGVAGSSRPSGMRPGFHTTIEVRWVTRPEEPGPNTAWIRIPVPLVAGEAMTPLQRLAATSDFGSAFSHLGRQGQTGFINADITLYLHRLPEGEWVGLQAERVVEPHGIGVAQGLLFDPRGLVGRCVLAVLANQRR